jgi:hypothetical protein
MAMFIMMNFGSVRGRPTPFQCEGAIQAAPMNLEEGDNAAIRVAAGDDGEDGERQHVRQLVELALRLMRIADISQPLQQRQKGGHGNLQHGCHPRS